MKSDDPLIKSFFEGMKRQDQKRSLPDFEELCNRKKRTNRFVPQYLKIAAAIGLLITLGAIYYVQMSDPREELHTTGHDVPLEEQAVEEFMSWEEPTQNLMEDF